jgi:putative RNA 2'-phosphotransferase
MNEIRVVKVSKYLSKHLRHQPERLGLTLDSAGWVSVEELLAACARHRMPITRAELDHVVASNDKKRFAFSPDGLRIRASQGHSITVDLDLAPADPPPLLFHGTVAAFLDQIRLEGLQPMNRHDVHLSVDTETAVRVGSRRGKPVILTIDAAAMAAAGHVFRVSDNGVWLVPSVPPEFIS